MKKSFLLFIFCLSNTILFAQNLEGAWGLKFGMTLEEVKSLVKKEKGYEPNSVTSPDKIGVAILEYRDIKFGTQMAVRADLNFYKDYLYSISSNFLPEQEEDFFPIYESVRNSITTKYFKPSQEFNTFELPYNENQNNKIKLEAVLLGKARVGCIWSFLTHALVKKSIFDTDAHGIILLSISNKMGIFLFYKDEVKSEIVDKLKNSDF